MIKIKAFAKINLILDLLGKRADGYHELRSVMQSVSLYDLITLKKNNLGVIQLTANKEITGNPEDNLAYRAAALFFTRLKKSDLGVDIYLDKNIPLAAGLAGGSADCAAVMAGLNKLFAANLSQRDLADLAATLGSDIPFCLSGGTMLAEGRGEKLTPLPFLGSFHGLLLKPPFPISTAKVYQAVPKNKVLSPAQNIPELYWRGGLRLDELQNNYRNELYLYAREIEPQIAVFLAEVKETKPAVCQMSGSGPTIFAFYLTKKERNKALDQLKAEEVYGMETLPHGLEFSII